MGRIVYKKNILAELKKKGYTSTRLEREHLLSSGAMQSIRTGKIVSVRSLCKICHMLECDVGDILTYVDDLDPDIEEDPYLR